MASPLCLDSLQRGRASGHRGKPDPRQITQHGFAPRHLRGLTPAAVGHDQRDGKGNRLYDRCSCVGAEHERIFTGQKGEIERLLGEPAHEHATVVGTQRGQAPGVRRFLRLCGVQDDEEASARVQVRNEGAHAALNELVAALAAGRVLVAIAHGGPANGARVSGLTKGRSLARLAECGDAICDECRRNAQDPRHLVASGPPPPRLRARWRRQARRQFGK